MLRKYTAAPWSISDLALEMKMPGAEAGTIWKDWPGGSTPLANVDKGPGAEEAAGNLRLMGTAPDLLNALCALTEAWKKQAEANGEEGLLPEDNVYNQALRAIGKFDKQLAEDIREGRKNHD